MLGRRHAGRLELVDIVDDAGLGRPVGDLVVVVHASWLMSPTLGMFARFSFARKFRLRKIVIGRVVDFDDIDVEMLAMRGDQLGEEVLGRAADELDGDPGRRHLVLQLGIDAVDPGAADDADGDGGVVEFLLGLGRHCREHRRSQRDTGDPDPSEPRHGDIPFCATNKIN